MGSYVSPPDWTDPTDGDDPDVDLGDVLSGRLADVTVDPVEAAEEERERR